MRCKTPRKGPRRGPPRLDPELENLASVIAEYELDNNAYGWFRMPWRDGWNAVGLGYAVGTQTEEYRWLDDVLRARSVDPSLYWQAEEQLVDVVNLAPACRAALRCLQVFIANSSGGGHVYNSILIPAFLHAAPETVFEDILEHRCRDSIGTTAKLQGDINDRTRAAFRIAWTRGLYMAAYSLPPAIEHTKMKLTVIKGPS